MSVSIINKARSRKAALRYNHPSRNIRMILVGGNYGATATALYLCEVLREGGDKVAVFTDRRSQIEGEAYEERYDTSAETVQRAISHSRKRARTVIMEVTDAVIASHVLASLQCDMTIVTSDGDRASATLDVPSAYTVVPESVSVESLSVAPHQLISFGDSALAEARVGEVTLYRGGTEITVTIDHQTTLSLSTYLLGRANAYSVAAAVAASYLLGISIDDFAEGIARLESVQANFEELDLGQVYRVYVDQAADERSIDLISASAKQLAKRRLLVVCDTSIPTAALDMLGKRADRVTVVEGEETDGRYHADNGKHAIELTFRAAKKDDSVLILGPQYASQLDNTTVAEMLSREVLEA